MEYMEFKGKTKGDAITEACRHFSIPSDKLEYEVIEEGKAGLFGLGAKPAVIKARVKEESSEAVETQKLVDSPEIASVKAYTENIPDIDVEAVSKKFLTDVFAAMELNVEINIKYNDSLKNLDVELSGDEMGVLIGKRGQTLDSLQYIISLVVNKESDSYIRIKVDTENYRERRKATLENLAKNLAYKVKRTRRPVSLEPMNPYERRVIHSVLQNDRYVETHSEGEEPYRKVVITLKKDYRERSPRSGYNREGRYNRENNYNRERGYRRERSYSREEVERPAENNEHNDSNDNV